MPRPQRCRKIRSYPEQWSFLPEDGETGQTPVILTLDEYETVRLLDFCGLTQEECAARMEVSRTTVTAIYDSARKKLAEVLVCGRGLRVSGGNVCLELDQFPDLALPKKGRDTMRIAVTYENGQVFQHFGRTPAFKIYDVEEGEIRDSRVVETNGTGHGALAGFLRALEAELDARLVYPRCLGSGVMEAWQPEGPWSRGPYGIEEPDTAASRLVEPEEIDAVLVPCVGFDGALRRLGHGAGYYDRYLPRCTKALCIGVAFEAQRLERVVTGEHDRSLDRIVTEREIIKP